MGASNSICTPKQKKLSNVRTLIKTSIEVKDDMIVAAKNNYMLIKILGTDNYFFKITIDIDELSKASYNSLEFIDVAIVPSDEKNNIVSKKTSLKIHVSMLKSTYEKLTNIAQFDNELEKRMRIVDCNTLENIDHIDTFVQVAQHLKILINEDIKKKKELSIESDSKKK